MFLKLSIAFFLKFELQIKEHTIFSLCGLVLFISRKVSMKISRLKWNRAASEQTVASKTLSPASKCRELHSCLTQQIKKLQTNKQRLRTQEIAENLIFNM